MLRGISTFVKELSLEYDKSTYRPVQQKTFEKHVDHQKQHLRGTENQSLL